MSRDDLEITLDGETAAALNRPSELAWPAEAVRGALRAPDAAPAGGGVRYAGDNADVPDAGHDASVRQSSGDPEPAIQADAGQADPGPIDLDGQTATAPDPGANAASAGGEAESISVPSSDGRGQVIIHAVNYYARPATTLSDLPNEWARNRARP